MPRRFSQARRANSSRFGTFTPRRRRSFQRSTAQMGVSLHAADGHHDGLEVSAAGFPRAVGRSDAAGGVWTPGLGLEGSSRKALSPAQSGPLPHFGFDRFQGGRCSRKCRVSLSSRSCRGPSCLRSQRSTERPFQPSTRIALQLVGCPPAKQLLGETTAQPFGPQCLARSSQFHAQAGLPFTVGTWRRDSRSPRLILNWQKGPAP